MKRIIYILGILLTLHLLSCENLLKEEVYSQLATDNFLATEEGLETVLYQAYNLMQRNGHDLTILIHSDAFMTGRGDGRLGAWEGSTSAPFRTWNWLSTQWNLTSHWTINYKVIYNCNTVLDNLENESFSQEFQTRMKAEALALRGHAYYLLFDYFGPVVIYTTTNTTEMNLPRASLEETKSRIESDLTDASALLPVAQDKYGKITKGGALGMLCKFYLNTKQWVKCANTARQIMDLNKYDLFADFTALFHIANEGNSEIIWVQPSGNFPDQRNTLAGLTYPADWPFTGTQSTFPARVYVPDWFVNSYQTGDKRANVIVKQYVNNKGVTITGYGKNQSYPFKYGLDPSADGGDASNDYIELRYADILLSRAEALNEINGPNPESISLINQIRKRAGIPDVQLTSFVSKDDLRNHILKERDWEFHFEGKTRQDMIRHGKLISDAKLRGISHAADYHQLYPVPQGEMDANSQIEQNPGY